MTDIILQLNEIYHALFGIIFELAIIAIALLVKR
jgi:hypothetical protein